MAKEIREVKAYRFYYKCGHKGVVVANERGLRGEKSARRSAEIKSQYECWLCEQLARDNE